MPQLCKHEAPKKQHWARGETNKGRHHLLLLHKQMHDKWSVAESQQACVHKLTACEVGVFSRKISQLSKIRPPLSLRSSLSSLPMGVFSRDYGTFKALAPKAQVLESQVVAWEWGYILCFKCVHMFNSYVPLLPRITHTFCWELTLAPQSISICTISWWPFWDEIANELAPFCKVDNTTNMLINHILLSNNR